MKNNIKILESLINKKQSQFESMFSDVLKEKLDKILQSKGLIVENNTYKSSFKFSNPLYEKISNSNMEIVITNEDGKMIKESSDVSDMLEISDILYEREDNNDNVVFRILEQYTNTELVNMLQNYDSKNSKSLNENVGVADLKMVVFSDEEKDNNLEKIIKILDEYDIEYEKKEKDNKTIISIKAEDDEINSDALKELNKLISSSDDSDDIKKEENGELKKQIDNPELNKKPLKVKIVNDDGKIIEESLRIEELLKINDIMFEKNEINSNEIDFIITESDNNKRALQQIQKLHESYGINVSLNEGNIDTNFERSISDGVKSQIAKDLGIYQKDITFNFNKNELRIKIKTNQDIDEILDNTDSDWKNTIPNLNPKTEKQIGYYEYERTDGTANGCDLVYVYHKNSLNEMVSKEESKILDDVAEILSIDEDLIEVYHDDEDLVIEIDNSDKEIKISTIKKVIEKELYEIEDDSESSVDGVQSLTDVIQKDDSIIIYYEFIPHE